MKIVMFYALEFWWKPYARVLEGAGEAEKEVGVKEAVVVFYQVEAQDPERRKKVIEKFVKNVKWLARKFDTKKVVLHSFSHLSLSKAPPEEARKIITHAQEKLQRGGFEIFETPYGWLNEWKIHVAGESLAKVYKEL